ncbi:MAG: Stk1 family PASTA domain-containing Ser/Thr kinase [Lachnospiraceae bacterium]|nr:Stk1 family PASTA domain-containing Ser/Thr kinase [Lachnospiraceae bacterium]
MIKIGMIIGDRYEILEKIGTGGMSDVYKAKDHKLNRFVAVKVLKQEFSENANFVSKFRIEAQAAAGLMHPNIVNVYDVGEENGIHYIVMELVEGITLKKYIEKKARLSVKEAVSIAIQVSMGIEAAHNSHIIHRDIKPQNIIISKEGKVKVTDFGIAKAATSNTITSNVMGSVHYTSPEQARGGYSDEKSDIYSLGITMFEMLTGRVPFNGETTVAIAIKHIQEEMPSPREYVSEIPICVEQIVFKCCQKSPDRRYQSMAELVDDLKKALITPDEDFVKVVDPDEEASTKFISDRDMAQIKRQSERREYMEEAMRLKRQSDVEDEEIEEDEDGDYSEDDYDEDYDPKMEKLTTILAIVAAVLIGGIILFLVGKTVGLFSLGDNSEKEENSIVPETQITEPINEQVEMINVIGMTMEEARTALVKLGLSPEFDYVESDSVEEGIVISADISTSTLVDVNSVVKVTVSAGRKGVEVPDVSGVSYAEAVTMLQQKGFVANKAESYSSEVEKGNVISQTPAAGDKAPSGSAVTVRVSLGAEENKVRVPNVIGLDEEDATVSLIEAGLTPGVVEEVNNEDTALTGLICYQSYSVGSYVEAGTVVDMKLSIGPKAVTYKYNGSIQAPTKEEDPDYKGDVSVHVVITSADGMTILDTTTSSFPISINSAGIKSATGTITFTYTVTTEPTTSTNPETGETITVPGTSMEKTVTRPIEFTEE